MASSVEPQELIAPACPRCDESLGARTSVPTRLFDRPLVRCPRCGARSLVDRDAPPAVVVACVACDLPFVGDEGGTCPRCESEETAPSEADADLAHAIESEVRRSLARRWTLVDAPAIRAYLDGLTRRIVPHLPAKPPEPRVTLCDSEEWRCLALPSGTVIVSTGLLAALADEAEFAFVLAHEFAHAGSRDVSLRLVRLGVHSIAQGDGGDADADWFEAAEDLLALGFGAQRERAADDAAFRALADCGYDLRSVASLFGRLGGEPSGSERYVLAHPTPDERLRALDAFRGRRATRGAGRVNREPFRRIAVAATRDADWQRLKRVRPDDPRPASPRRRGRTSWRVWLALGAGLALLIAWWLARGFGG